MAQKNGRGPRAARGEVRERLLDAARTLFTSQDFSTITVKDIAAQAGVDPGLVSYYFGGKAGLFREAMSMPRNPSKLVLDTLNEGINGAGERVLQSVFTQWDIAGTSEQSGKVLISSLLSSPDTLTTFQKWLEDDIIELASRKLTGENTRARAAAATGIVFQIIALRYIIKVEPLTSLPDDEIITLYAPLIQNLLSPQ